MSSRVCVIDVPGLDADLLAKVPASSALGKWLANQTVLPLTPTVPAVTCSMQATLTTGVLPAQHGIIANGIPTFRSPEDQALVDASNFAEYRRQISFWEQSNQFLQAPRFWQNADGTSRVKTALLFFQNSMPGCSAPLRPAADIVLTPKPDHGPDGKFTSLCWSQPAPLVPQLFEKLGPFPLMNYWGPMAGIASSQWIARAAAMVWSDHQPQLQLTYIPHLDYDLQRFGPASPQAEKAVVDLTAALEPLLDAVQSSGGKIVLLSEYSIKPVHRVVQPNRMLADAGLLVTRATEDGPLIDFQRSRAIAMVDHQIAHIYLQNKNDLAKVRSVFASSVEILKDGPQGQAAVELQHPRSGDLVLGISDGWFDYRWWENDSQAPAFATTVDIHRKPGYDPLELFFDPATRRIVQDSSRIKGSHGMVKPGEALLIGEMPAAHGPIAATAVAKLLMQILTSN